MVCAFQTMQMNEYFYTIDKGYVFDCLESSKMLIVSVIFFEKELAKENF